MGLVEEALEAGRDAGVHTTAGAGVGRGVQMPNGGSTEGWTVPSAHVVHSLTENVQGMVEVHHID